MSMIHQARALIAAEKWAEAAELLRPPTGTGDPEFDYMFGSLPFGGDDSVSPAEALAALRRAADPSCPADTLHLLRELSSRRQTPRIVPGGS
jgi:hypothetical protein